MAKTQPSYKPLDLKGASQHHDLKDQPGEKSDETHKDTSESASDELTEAVSNVKADTEIADALRDAVEEDEA